MTYCLHYKLMSSIHSAKETHYNLQQTLAGSLPFCRLISTALTGVRVCKHSKKIVTRMWSVPNLTVAPKGTTDLSRVWWGPARFGMNVLA